jgi:hypothetical protein
MRAKDPQLTTMRFSFLIALLLFCTISTVAQGNHGSVEDEEKVQEVVGSLVADREKAHVLLRDLSEIEGYVVLLGYDDFQLGTKKRARAGQRIKYMDVLAIWGKGHSVSLIPDPKTPGHGRWDDLRKLPPNSLVEVVTAAGEPGVADFVRATQTALSSLIRTAAMSGRSSART